MNIKRITENDKSIFEARLSGLSVEGIAEIYNYSEQQIYAIIKKMKNAMENRVVNYTSDFMKLSVRIADEMYFPISKTNTINSLILLTFALSQSNISSTTDGYYRLNLLPWFNEKKQRKKERVKIESLLADSQIKIVQDGSLLFSLFGIIKGSSFPVYETVCFDGYILTYKFSPETYFLVKCGMLSNK